MYITRPHRPEINVHFERKLLARLQSRNSRAMNTAPSVPAYGPITGHARVKGDIFGVYHGDPKLLLNMPSTNEAPSPSPSSMQGNFWSPSYVSPSTPYIPFIPLTNPWYGPLLGRLYYGHVIPVEEVTPGRWGLPPRIREDWYALELNLHAVLFAMMERSRLQHPQCMVPFGYPYRFGYLVLYRTRNAARYIARRSINGFLPLLGNLSMFFFYLRLAEMTIGLEGWRDEVCKVAQVHPQWLADLEHSAAGDLTIPRIGGIIDLSLPPGTDPTLVRESELDFMIGSIISKRLRIPLYIRWGKIGHYAQSLGFDVQRRADGVLKLPPQSPIRRHLSFDLTGYRSDDPSAFSTRRGPQWSTPWRRYGIFFARRQKKNHDLMSHETSGDRARHLQRVQHAWATGVPGKTGARVYVWELSDAHYIRRAAGRNNYEGVWRIIRRLNGFMIHSIMSGIAVRSWIRMR
ncbi:hypothetical protein B0H10DRAFT_1947144 [Mycena sp. CBHHK59/15]|nr:hypothetical protein B0H10DRAFT_1947144 [Mycena sp. CBHHK59/15]